MSEGRGGNPETQGQTRLGLLQPSPRRRHHRAAHYLFIYTILADRTSCEGVHSSKSGLLAI